jgi:hypothetical protein
MPIDPTISEVLHEITKKNKQSDQVAKKLINWFEQVANGNEKLTDREAVFSRLDNLCEMVSVSYSEEEE